LTLKTTHQVCIEILDKKIATFSRGYFIYLVGDRGFEPCPKRPRRYFKILIAIFEVLARSSFDAPSFALKAIP